MTHLSRQCSVTRIDLKQATIGQTGAQMIPSECARENCLISISCNDGNLEHLMSAPTNVFALDDIHFMKGNEMLTLVGSEPDIRKAIEIYYG